MKLIIKDYLSMMKESGELDELLPNLLLSMGIKPISKAQIGVRQYGVDVAAVGIDKKDNIEKLLLFTIKKGDVGRADWNTGEQAVKQSLDDIKDVYIVSHVELKYQKRPIKIILCSGGEIKQDTQLDWTTYTKKYSKKNKIEYDFWGGDELALLIEEHLFNESILPTEIRRKFRKTLALIGEPDYELYDYYSMLDSLLFSNKLKKTNVKNIQKQLNLINLSLNIIFIYAKDRDNLKHALLSGERTILNVWGFIFENELFRKSSLMKIYSKIIKTYLLISSEYFLKLTPHLFVENGLSFNTPHFILESKLLFEQLGILSLFGISNINKNTSYKNNNNMEIITNYIKSMIMNHKTLLNPVLDSQIIDISLAIILLKNHLEIEFIDQWIEKILNHIEFADKSNKKYIPISNDSMEELVDFNILEIKKKGDVFKTSNLLPILAQWCVSLGLIENYKNIYRLSQDMYKGVALQIWYPDNDTENFMYKENAAIDSGLTEVPIIIPENIKEYANQMDMVKEKNKVVESFSFVKKGFNLLSLISSRHFRMPVFPIFWQLYKSGKKEEL